MLLFHIRESLPFAFLQGFYETWRDPDSAGRTHWTNMDWNEWYDHGMNAAEWLGQLKRELTWQDL